ncbi:MAG: hypothetical protein PHR35_05850 [Kiritimatiellae bacterium]|nr:hypothetical protein [Kiritimatiellia bacterium]
MQRYKLNAVQLAVALACIAGIGMAASHYASHAYLAAVNVGPGNGAREVEFISASTTTADSYVELQSGKAAVYKVATAQSTAVTNVVLNTTNGLDAADTVLIVHGTGAVDYRTIAGMGADGLCTFTVAPSAALTTAARLWELETAARYYLPFTSLGTNETKVMLPLQVGGALYKSYGVPIRLQLSGTNCVLSVTTGD